LLPSDFRVGLCANYLPLLSVHEVYHDICNQKNLRLILKSELKNSSYIKETNKEGKNLSSQEVNLVFKAYFKCWRHACQLFWYMSGPIGLQRKFMTSPMNIGVFLKSVISTACNSIINNAVIKSQHAVLKERVERLPNTPPAP
jgi:hypothetical protein